MSRVSDGAYKIYREEKHGIRACCNTLSEEEIELRHDDIEMLEYFLKTKNSTCDINKLIEVLT